MRRFGASMAIVCLAAALAGCGPAIPDDELGRVVENVPALPGMEERYPLPEVKGDPRDPSMGPPSILPPGDSKPPGTTAP